jgi:hypothetical protein
MYLSNFEVKNFKSNKFQVIKMKSDFGHKPLAQSDMKNSFQRGKFPLEDLLKVFLKVFTGQI